VWRQGRLARRAKPLSPGFDGPGGAILLGQIDRRHSENFSVLDINKHRPAIGHVAIADDAAAKPRSEFESCGLAHHQRLRKPICEMLRPFDGEREILLCVDLVEPVDRWHQQRSAGRSIFEHQLDVGFGMQTGA
jgi:hypothetical protein